MNHPLPLDEVRHPLKMRRFLVVAWLVILAKCAAVWWAVGHWQLPVHPGWVVYPTLLMAAIATGLWLGPHDDY